MIEENSASEAVQASTFLGTLFYQLDAGEHIEIRYKLSGAEQPMKREFLKSAGSAADMALMLGEQHDVYIGVAPRQGKVGTKDGISRLFALWGDLDVKGDHTSADRLKQLDSLSCVPSIVVSSGGGYHPYWLLEQHSKGSSDLARAERIMMRIAEGLDGDPVHDRTRILRVPRNPEPQVR
jgi:hypothetical protein